MSNRTLNMTDQLYEYIQSVSVHESTLFKRLRKETAKQKMASMQISPEQGQFMSFLLKLIQAQKTIEIGVFTGYSTLCTACALPDHGLIIACDISDEWTSIGKTYWKEARVSHKIDLRLAPADKTLQQLLWEEKENTFDFAFIDADKENYDIYYEHCLKLIRPGGLIAIDNVLWGGSVVDPTINDVETQAIRELNKKLHMDLRIDMSLIPISDGLTLVRKKE